MHTGLLGTAWRYLWALPCTLVGLMALVPWLAARAPLRWRQGVLEACLDTSRGRLAAAFSCRLPFDAITLGHVVLARSPQALARWRVHERAHVRQCERWGPLFFAAYLLAGAWQWLRGRDAYRDNPFEVQARAAADDEAMLRAGGCAPAAGSSRTSVGCR